MPKIFLVDGPAGSGKSTITPLLLRHFGKRLHHCLRVTTRPQRPDDKNYIYIDQVEFGRLLTSGQLAAYRTFRGHHSYGVPRKAVEDAIEKGFHVFSLIDLGTAEQARKCWPDCVTIFLMAPLEILEKRLKDKGAHTEEQIEERLENAEKAFSKAPYYDYVIPNRQGQLEKTKKHLISIFEKEMKEEIT